MNAGTTAWTKHWNGPVAAIRPYLFQKCFLLMLATDLLVLMVERGGRYGLDSVPFNVAHFRWLDTVHQRLLPGGLPSATYYVTILVVTAALFMLLVLIGHRRWLLAIATVAYTYCWSMSRLDSYLHHYLLTLVLCTMVFFPAIDPRTLREGLTQDLTRRKSSSTPPAVRWAVILAVLAGAYRWSLSETWQLSATGRWTSMVVCFAIAAAAVFFWTRKHRLSVGPTVHSWAFRLLGTTVGIIYVFTSIAKMDSEWCSGHTLRAVGATEDVLRPLVQLAGTFGMGPDLFWSLLATLVIPLELALAVGYFLAIRQDEPEREGLRRLGVVVWVLALALHVNNEMMNLVIQWFGYYMLLLATVILLPARYLRAAATVFYWPEAALRDRYDAWLAQRSNSQATLILGAVSAFSLFALILAGFFIWIAGARVASCILAAALVLALLVGMVFGFERRSVGLSLAAGLVGLWMIAATTQSSLRFDYFDLRGKTLQQMGRHDQALVEMREALIFPASPAAEAELLTNLALSLRRTNQAEEARTHYLRAIELDHRAFLAHYSLANLLTERKEYTSAEEHYRHAIRIKPDFSDAYVNLGSMLAFTGRHADAIACFQSALVIEPEAADIRQLLENAKRSLP